MEPSNPNRPSEAPLRHWTAEELQNDAYGFGAAWFNPLVVEIFDHILQQVMQQQPEVERIVEVGSGMGRIVSLSKYATAITPTDKSPDIVAARRRRGETIMLAEAATLPDALGAHCADIICAINVFDCLPRDDLDRALDGIVRTLKPAGALIHLLDMNAHHKTLLRDLQKEGLVPFPARIGRHYGVINMRQDHLFGADTFLLDAALGTPAALALRSYAEDAVANYERMLRDLSPNDIDVRATQVQVGASLFGETVKPQDLNDIFQTKLADAAKRAGILIEEQAYRTQSATQVGHLPSQNKPHNRLTSERGFAVSSWDSSLPQGMIRIDVEALCFIGRQGQQRDR